MRSLITPADTEKSITGNAEAVWISATNVVECVSVSISHCAPTTCIQAPILLTN
jgi:hypothetical protein